MCVTENMDTTLAQLATKKLIECKSSLGDIGDVPVNLLEPVLVECDADQLDRIESSTARGHSGRDLSVDTWPLWYRFVKESMSTTLKKNEILDGIDRRDYGGPRVNVATPLRHVISGSVPVLDYKRLYKEIERKKKERLVKAGEALRAKFRVVKEQKMQRCVHVLDHSSSQEYRNAQSSGRKKAPVAATKKNNTMQRLSQKLGIGPPPTRQTAHEQFLLRAEKRSLIRKHCGTKRLPTAEQLRVPAHNTSRKQQRKTLASASLFDS